MGSSPSISKMKISDLWFEDEINLDMMQLSPVVNREKRSILRKYSQNNSKKVRFSELIHLCEMVHVEDFGIDYLMGPYREQETEFEKKTERKRKRKRIIHKNL